MTANSPVPPESDLTIRSYQKLALETDRLKNTGNPLDLPMLGFIGEAGGLLSAVKKRKRDDIPTASYFAAVKEELGDFIWYLAVLSSRAGVPLESIFVQAMPKPWTGKGLLRFEDAQAPFLRTREAPIDRLIALLISMSGDLGAVMTLYARNPRAWDRTKLEAGLVCVARSLMRAASAARIKTQEAAHFQLLKAHDRWPGDKVFYPALLDATADANEQLPRDLVVRIEERTVRARRYVFQSCSGINIGDPLTDNIRDSDDYRFHDVFHYAYAAVLGWSPVTRALLKLKRKSDPETDESEDGARAILIEEGVSGFVFTQGKSLGLFEKVKRGELSYDLLKTIRQFVRGYEVESAPLWLWEEAILAGFKCFRVLKENRGGIVTMDMNKRRIQIAPLTP
ncbi:MAG TPA: pyrophosphatase [Hyphomonadaceae bacterium]|nr:pyrophosphatase [Hyphomonadaceae bacterium]